MGAGDFRKAFSPFPAACVLGILVIATAFVKAEQLPIRTYTTADGLARDQVNRIVRDSRGFLWFCTEEGLSRFDGYKFTNYTTADGLPHRSVTDFLETRGGAYWVATEGGVCRFNPKGSSAWHGEPRRVESGATREERHIAASEPVFVSYCHGDDKKGWAVYRLVEDVTGVIWCGAGDGLYRLQQQDGKWTLDPVDIGMPAQQGVIALMEDHRGVLWAGSYNSGLYARWPDGRAERYTMKNGLPGNSIKALLEDREGRLWVGTTMGLSMLVAEPDPARPVVARSYGPRDGLGSDWITSLFQSADGKIWIGTLKGLSELSPSAGSGKPMVRTYTTANGLINTGVGCLAEDRDDNLWIACGNGAMKMARNGFTTYNRADGLGSDEVAALIEDRAGEFYAISSHQVFISRFDGRGFTSIHPDLPKNITYFGWGWNQITFQDQTGEWWVATGQGLCRFPRVNTIEQLANTLPRSVYTRRNGLMSEEVFRLFEDSKGDIWISMFGQINRTKWERATGTFHYYSESDGVPASFWPISFCQDAGDNLWIGSSGSGLIRYASGRFTTYTTADGLPIGWVGAMYLDHLGRLWIATSQGGLGRIDETRADHPRFTTYTTAEGLSSNQANCITEDRWGHIYVGTGRGLDRLDPATGHVKHYTAADGLIRGEVRVAFRDRQGTLWFGGGQDSGLSRLIPEPDPPGSPPPILVTGLRIAGDPYPLSELGETEVSKLELGPNQNDVQIDFVGIGFGMGEIPRYQYMLQGAHADWSPPTDQRSIRFASLSPGTYRFLVRAVTAAGTISASPATVTFTILPPIWRRWWFLGLAALLAGAVIYTLYRYRLARLLELERVRIRIATDLHDDIGASLSQIAILSEVVQQRVGKQNGEVAQPLGLIAGSSRELVDSMSDIVWAIDPRKDHLRDLAQRMRRLASDVCSASNIEFDLRTPEAGQDTRLGADLRREVFLIFKESLNNIARHSACGRAEVDFRIEEGWLTLRLCDDGKGFDILQPSDGHGLASMRERAQRLGGTLQVESTQARGTMVLLRVPLSRRGSWGRRKSAEAAKEPRKLPQRR
jgi:ligand-binding sensor domain-containing protein/two-component sensor histidine kinase